MLDVSQLISQILGVGRTLDDLAENVIINHNTELKSINYNADGEIDIFYIKFSTDGNIEYHFKSYYAKQFLNGRIIKNGNAAIFFEPMSAFSLFLYDKINRSFL
mgnify:CR=1 FL=1